MADIHANAAALEVAAADIRVKVNEVHGAIEAAVMLVAAVAVQAGALEARAVALRAQEVAQRAEELHAEHHPGTFVPSLDSCPEHTRAEYERMVRDLLKGTVT